MPDRVVGVKLKLNKSQFITDTATIEAAMNATWKRVAAKSSIIGKTIKENVQSAAAAVRSAFGTDEIGRGPFMKLLASLQTLKNASLEALKKNAATLKAMFSADEIGRTPYMRLRDATNKLRAGAIASVKKNFASAKEFLRPDAIIASVKRNHAAFKTFMAPDEVGRGPLMKMLDSVHKLEGKSIAAFRRIGDAAKNSFGKARDWWGARTEAMSQGGGFGGRARKWLGGMFRGSVADEPGQRGALTAHGIAGAMAAKDLIMGGVSSAIGKGMDLLSEAGNNSEKAAQISVSARSAGGAYIDHRLLEAEAYAVAQQVKGTTAEGALDAMASFLTLTGDLDTARKSVATFATVARATGANLSDVSASTAAISQQFKITDPEQIKEVLASLTYQGKAGAIEISDLATGLQTLAASGASFGLSGVKGVKTLGGITQIAKQGSGSAAETFTAVQGLFRELTAKADKLEGKGVKVYEGKGVNKRTRDPIAIFTDAIAKLGGNDVAKKASELQSIFNDSLKALKPLMSMYDLTYRNTQGTEAEKVAAATAEVRKAFDNAINAAGDWSDVVSDSAKMQNTNSAKITAAMEKFKGQLGETVLPQVSKFIDALSKSPTAIEGFTTAIIATGETLAKLNRLLGIGEEPGDNISAKDTDALLAKQAKEKADNALRDRGLMTSDDVKEFQSLGILDATGASKLRMDKSGEGLQSVPMTSDPLAEMAKSSELQTGLAGALRSGLMGQGGAAFGAFNAQTSIAPTSKMQEKQAAQVQEQAAVAQASAARTATTTTSRDSAFVPLQLRGIGGGAPAAPAPKQGPLNIGNVVRVHLVGDDTTRGTIPAPTPGPVPRL